MQVYFNKYDPELIFNIENDNLFYNRIIKEVISNFEPKGNVYWNSKNYPFLNLYSKSKKDNGIVKFDSKLQINTRNENIRNIIEKHNMHTDGLTVLNNFLFSQSSKLSSISSEFRAYYPYRGGNTEAFHFVQYLPANTYDSWRNVIYSKETIEKIIREYIYTVKEAKKHLKVLNTDNVSINSFYNSSNYGNNISNKYDIDLKMSASMDLNISQILKMSGFLYILYLYFTYIFFRSRPNNIINDMKIVKRIKHKIIRF